MGEALIHDALAEMQGRSHEGPEYVMDIVTHKVRAASPWDSLEKAIDSLLEYNIYLLVVLKKEKRAGIITEIDLVRAIGNQNFARVPCGG